MEPTKRPTPEFVSKKTSFRRDQAGNEKVLDRILSIQVLLVEEDWKLKNVCALTALWRLYTY